MPGDLAGEVVARLGDLELAADVEPRPAEDRLHLVLEVLRVGGVVERQVVVASCRPGWSSPPSGLSNGMLTLRRFGAGSSRIGHGVLLRTAR